MLKKATVLTLFVLLILLLANLFAQEGPTPLGETTLVDSSVYNGIYRGVQTQFFLEPTTGNMVVAWYRYFSADAVNPRQITAATSTDKGTTWKVHEQINNGVGAGMNARYPSVWGTSATPIVVYSDRNPEGSNQNSRPVFATDILGWGGDFFNNTFVDNMDKADTVLYGRYLTAASASDNENLIAVGSYHNAAPGEALYYYYSTDGGNTWNGPTVPATADTLEKSTANYVYDISSSGLGVALGNNNTAFVSGLAKFTSDHTLWQVIYVTSDDGGATWDPVSLIPGTEDLNFVNNDTYFNFTSPLMDKDGNWHIFALGTDTTEDGGSFPQKYRAWDFVYNGSDWAINKFVFPALIDNGLVAWGDYPPDEERRFCSTPSLGPDGTIYYVFTDVMDTTGAGGNVANFNFHMRVVYSEDNGATWKGPVSILEDWDSPSVQGAARFADDNLHIVFRDTLDNLYHMAVPTQTIKDLATAIDDGVVSELPQKFSLHQNFPNPFNPTTTIRFDLAAISHVKLTVYNALGQKVAQLVNKNMTAGFKGVVWDASNMPSGIYFYRLETDNYTETKRMVLLK